MVSVLLHNSVCTVFCSAQTRLYTLPRKPLEIMIQASMFSELIPIFSSVLQYNTYHYDSESSVMLNCFSTWLNNESSLCCTVCHDVWIPILDLGVKLSLVWHKHSLWRPAALPLSVLATSFLRLDKLSLTYLCTRAVIQTRCSEGLCENDQGAMESAKGGDREGDLNGFWRAEEANLFVKQSNNGQWFIPRRHVGKQRSGVLYWFFMIASPHR